MIGKIANKALQEKICASKDLFHYFENGMTVGMSGFTPSGYPKTFPIEFAEYVKENEVPMELRVVIGASIGANVEDPWADAGITKWRYPYQAGKILNGQINTGNARLMDTHLSNYAAQAQSGFLSAHKDNNIDIGIIEVDEVLEDGSIVLAGSVGLVPEIVEQADKLILEVNTKIPSHYGLHDIVYPVVPPKSANYYFKTAEDRIGEPFVRIDTDKVIGIIEGKHSDDPVGLAPSSEEHLRIADFIINFFEQEVQAGRLPENLLPLQSGVGNIANAVVDGLKASRFTDMYVWTEVIQDTVLDLIDCGKVKYCSGTSLTLTNEGLERLYSNFDFYKEKIVLRPLFISNGPAYIRSLGCIAMNTPVEFDIYGHANSTHVMGSKIINGIGGSGDFLRNAYLSIVHAPSARGEGNSISSVVPMASHVDHTEHDIHVIVTEQGLADLRGLPPVDKARSIIKNCAHPDYKGLLTDYLELSMAETYPKKMGHEPHMLDKVFNMYHNLNENGTMKLDQW